MYELNEKGQDGRPLLNTLVTIKNSTPTFATTQGHQSSTIRLRCSRPARSDDHTLLLPSLTSWAFAYRVEPTLLSIKEQQQKCLDQGIPRLLFSDPALDPTHYSPDWAGNCRAIVSYSGNHWEDLLRFGTFGARLMNLVRQGEASVFECVLAAQEKFGSGWMIMANP